jgi:hypothetical protein
MYAWLIFSVCLVAMLMGGFQGRSAQVEVSAVARGAKAEMDLYREFLYAASQYMAGIPPVEVPRRVTWDEIRSASTTPPGLVQAGIPAGWRLEVAGDGSWVACTELSERTATAIGQWAPLQHGSPGHSVVGTMTTGEATAWARRCDP